MNQTNGVNNHCFIVIFESSAYGLFLLTIGIELVSHSVDVLNENQIDQTHVELTSSSIGNMSLDQVKYQYTRKTKDDSSNIEASSTTTNTDDISIEDLMAHMKAM
jgi:hypothetical protein